MDTDTTALQQDIAQYLAQLASLRRYSPHSISNYRRDLDKLTDFAHSQQITTAAGLDSAHLRQWVATLRHRGLAPRSVQRALSAARSFFNFLIKAGRLRANPAAGISAPKTPQPLPKALDTDQAARLLDDPEQGENWLGARDRAMAELLYSSGLRLAELAALDIADLDRGQGLITVTGKGNKTRTIPVGAPALKALAGWLRIRGDARPQDQALFISRTGRRLSHRGIQLRLKKIGARALGRNVHPHMLRHSFASHVLQSSGDLRAVQELLGHANLSTTQIYTHLDFQHLAKIYDAAHPRAGRQPPPGTDKPSTGDGDDDDS